MTLATMSAWVRAALVGVVLAVGAVGAHAADNDAAAQVAREATQPSNNAPVWRAVNQPVEHYSAIKTPEAGVLIQASGNDWALFRNGVITVYGGWLVSLALTAVALMFAVRGPIKLKNSTQRQAGQTFHAGRALRPLVSRHHIHYAGHHRRGDFVGSLLLAARGQWLAVWALSVVLEKRAQPGGATVHHFNHCDVYRLRTRQHPHCQRCAMAAQRR